MKQAFVCIMVVLALCLGATAQTTRPIPQIHQVVIISVDGLRPDLALRANTPNLHALLNAGSFSFWARTTAESAMLPGFTHSPDDPRSRHILWLVTGPGIRRGLDLTLYGDLVINTEDTFSTAAYLLGIPIIQKVDGYPVLQIIDPSNEELLRAAP
jgi:hypothetical protein